MYDYQLLGFLFGVIVIYTTIHFFFIQRKSYEVRTTYEKAITWVAIIFISIVYLTLASKPV